MMYVWVKNPRSGSGSGQILVYDLRRLAKNATLYKEEFLFYDVSDRQTKRQRDSSKHLLSVRSNRQTIGTKWELLFEIRIPWMNYGVVLIFTSQ